MDKMDEVLMSSKEYIINHVFLPLRLPQQDDEDPGNDLALCNTTLEGVKSFTKHINCKDWTLVQEMFSNLLKLYQQPHLTSRIKSMTDMLMTQVWTNGVLIFPVRAQNACVIVRTFGDETAFDTFRVEPPNEIVMTTVGRVIRSFPDTSITIPNSALSAEFCYELCSFLSQMDCDTLEDAAPTTKKAGEKVLEVRDTPSSHYITRLFMAILAGLKGSYPTRTTAIVKHTRSDVIWTNAYKPWRRSPLWLIMRVTLQSTLHHLGHPPTIYKSFMVFLMATILSSRTCHNISSDVLFCMQSKIANRMRKLPVWPDNVTNFVKSVMEKTKKSLEDQWEDIQSKDTKQRCPADWKPSHSDVKSSTNLSLPHSRSYLMKRMDVTEESHRKFPFCPQETPRLFRSSRPMDEFEPATLRATLQKDRSTALFDIEEFVLDTFSNPESFRWPFTSSALAECIQIYIKYAKEEYSGNPETTSIMIITVFVLWIVLDQLVTTRIPLLREYSPGIPRDLLQSLMLSQSLQIERYIMIQNYLSRRYSEMHPSLPSIFGPYASSNAFSNRYFWTSSKLQSLKKTIEDVAHQKQAEKQNELTQKEDRRQSLLSRAGKTECKYDEDGDHMYWNCSKCQLQKEAREMKIDVFEWPLPDNRIKAEGVVFELDVPVDFKIWRATTYNLLIDFCRPGLPLPVQTSPSAKRKLINFSGLNPYIRQDISDVTIGSSTKAFVDSHYRSIKVATASSDNVCVKNGLSFALYDQKNDRWITPDIFEDCTFVHCCTWQIPSQGRYSHLAYAVQGVSHAPNQSIADQSAAPADLELHEHASFGVLRSGGHIQWLNIAREMRTKILSFSGNEVRSLLLTAVLQVGPVLESQLEWHVILADAHFAASFLQEVQHFLVIISDNWAHIITLETLIMCIIRLLASTHPVGGEIASQAITALRHARAIAHKWMCKIHKKLSSLTENSSTDSTTDLQRRLCAAAAICRSTYNVEPYFLHDLISGCSDIQVLIECHIRLHDYTPPGTPLEGLSHLLVRDKRFSLAMTKHYSKLVSAHPTALDQAIKSVWDGYDIPGNSSWVFLTAPNNLWVTTETIPTTGSLSLKVHLNLLRGSLLIEGKPLGRLPAAITSHSTYIRLLNHQILDVTPPELKGMDYTTRRALNPDGYKLHFKLAGDHLIIKASLNGESLELIPHTVFRSPSTNDDEDLPNIFIENYCHWLKQASGSTHILEFRPLSPDTQWTPSKQNWQLRLSQTLQGTLDAFLQDGEESTKYLVDKHSEAFAVISGPLTALESQLEHIYVTYDEELATQVIVELPRFKLSFSWDGNFLTSRNLREMIVDEDQDARTLYGLHHRLVLKSLRGDHTNKNHVRSILIPYGEINFERSGDHVKVQVETKKMANVNYFRYDINQHLQSLVGTNLLSELYRIYLHGLTSYPLPDPLMGHTGAEEALKSLCSARCKSFMRLSDEEQHILMNIAKLNPCRAWYPEHLQVMQTVTWVEISSLSQHWAYPVIVDSILKYNQEISVFTPNSSEDPTDLVTKQQSLATRAMSHNYYLYSAKEYQVDFNDFDDCKYTPSEIESHAHAGDSLRANHMSKAVQDWPIHTDSLRDIWGQLNLTKQPIIRTLPGFTPSYRKSLLQPDISKLWLPFYITCTGSASRNHLQAQLAFSLSSMAYRVDDVQLLLTFLAFSTTPELRQITPPSGDSFKLSAGISPSLEELSNILDDFRVDLSTVSDDLPVQIRYGETQRSFLTRRRNEYERRCEDQSQLIAQQLVSHWERDPCSVRSYLESQRDCARYIDINSRLEDQIQAKFLDWHRNILFKNHIDNVQHALLEQSRQPMPRTSKPLPSFVMAPSITMTVRMAPWPTLSSIASNRAYIINNYAKLPVEPIYLEPSSEGRVQPTYCPQFDDLLDYFVTHGDPLHQKYGELLQQSQESMVSQNIEEAPTVGQCSDAELVHYLLDYLRRCTEHHQSVHQDICLALRPWTNSELFQDLGFHWPRINTRAILEILLHVERHWQCQPRGTSNFMGWITPLRSYAASILMVQRAERLVTLNSENTDDLARELSNVPSFNNQSADWMVIQIDGNFLARPIQLQVAQEMMEPSEKVNTVIQLNMGEGKSSVIVPLIACSLADGQKLARVIVLKPLAKSMFALLVKRLSGLANRRVFYLPFSRDVRINDSDSDSVVTRLSKLYKSCLREKGIIVAQPEHILSFRLMGIDLIRDKKPEAEDNASRMLPIQRWLNDQSRDILDESDEILNVKYQLIYTSGRQRPLENHPNRWLTIQEVLRSIKEHAIRLDSADAIEVEHTKPCDFPIIRILHPPTGKMLIKQVAVEAIKSDQFRLLSAPGIRRLALEYITHSSSIETQTTLSRTLSSDLWNTLLLYRGLFVSGILQFVLEEKRWRVNYGLDPKRTLLAVPYRAKDVPSLRADFGHPDVAVILTCLSYYYGGLTREQVNLCFQLLMKLDNPDQEYNLWITDNPDVPENLCQYIGVNLDDFDQQEQLYSCMKRNQAMIDFYLSKVVFPREAKQFPKKLSTSAWDLAEKKEHPTTGFSGTNDNQHLLPVSISQKDPVGQLGTNARVIECLLRPENDHYRVVRRGDAQILSSQDYLEYLLQQSPPIRVLLDVGAQMLDKKNDEIARMWLQNTHVQEKIEAIVFFNEDDQLCVMTRDHAVESFELSHYSQRLELCAIYLDDAHTRGTDLKLPRNYRAAVTLGSKLTKDRLVQGCMRMRKLGRGQTIMFFAPPEVDNLIRKLADKNDDHKVHMIDVLRWAMNETCLSIRHNVPHWAQQGADYHKRAKAWDEFLQRSEASGSNSLASNQSLSQLRNEWEGADARTLGEMYGIRDDPNEPHPALKYDKLRSHLNKLGFDTLNDISADEEQEREVSHEAEQEREVERPPPAEAAEHQLHPDVKSLVDSGQMKDGSSAFVRMFGPLAHLDSSPQPCTWSPNLWSTQDFASTIVGSPSDATEFQRPVNWLLTTTGPNSKQVVALSPYEANALLPAIRKSKMVHLHMYAPRVNPAMRSFEDLKSFAIPTVPSDWIPPSDMLQVNLWSGQLYFQDFAAYHDTRMVLGIVGKDPDSDAKPESWGSDGFVLPDGRKGRMKEICRFDSSPLAFLKEVVGLRQKGKSYQSTNIGKIFDRRLLGEADIKVPKILTEPVDSDDE